MSTKPIFVRLFSFLLLLVLVGLYLWLYLFPTMEAVNRERRETNDLSTKIEDIRKERINFSFMGERENLMLQKMTEELHKALPKIRGKGDWQRTLKKVRNYIETLAMSHSITPIEIAESGQADSPAASALKYRTLMLSFTGDPAKALNFINRLSWWEQLLSPRAISIIPGIDNPQFNVELRIYYVQGRKALDNLELPGPMVDRDSEILLESVFETAPFRFSKQALPGPPGRGIPGIR